MELGEEEPEEKASTKELDSMFDELDRISAPKYAFSVTGTASPMLTVREERSGSMRRSQVRALISRRNERRVNEGVIST